jgi:probable HAF family extracellular repeat protein
VLQNGSFTVIEPPAGLLHTEAIAINDQGQVIGLTWATTRTADRAFLWDNGTFTVLDSPSNVFTQPNALNEKAEIAGILFGGSDGTQGFHWAGGTKTILPAVSGIYAWPLGINTAGTVVGQVIGMGFSRQAAMWRLLTAEDRIDGILEDLQVLIETGALPENRVGPLSSTLNNALAAIERDQTSAAIGQMQAFINQINALLRARQINLDDAQDLVDSAGRVITQLLEG